MGQRIQAKGFAVFIAAGILLSRISGLIRERVLAYYFGNSVALDAFRAAFRIPNALQNLLGEGVLSASFIPVYARLLEEGEEELAGRVAGAVATILALFTGAVVLVGVLAAPLLVDVIALGFEGEVRDFTIHLVQILFPGTGLLVMYAWSLGILNSHRRFFLSYVAPVLMNISMIAAMVIFATRVADLAGLAVALSWGFVAGAAIQFLVQIPAVLRHERHLRLSFGRMLSPVRTVFVNVVPVVMTRGVVQVSAFVDTMIASKLAPFALSGLGYAQTLYILPISLFGMSVAAAELPEMSRVQGTSEERSIALRQRIRAAVRQVSFFVVPTVVAFLAIGYELVTILYQTGNFGAADTRFVWYILCGSALGLLPITLGRVFVSGFHALQETRTPLRYAIGRVTIGAATGILFAFPLRHLVIGVFDGLGLPLPALPNIGLLMGAVGLTAASALAGSVEAVLLHRGLVHRIGRWESSAGFFLKVGASAIAAGGAAVAFRELVLPNLRLDEIHAALHGGAVAVVFALVYGVGVLATGVPEARRLVSRVLRRGKS